MKALLAFFLQSTWAFTPCSDVRFVYKADCCNQPEGTLLADNKRLITPTPSASMEDLVSFVNSSFPEDESFYAVNLLKYKNRTAYDIYSDFAYATLPEVGAYPVIPGVGDVVYKLIGPKEYSFDSIVTVFYPNANAFMGYVMRLEMGGYEEYRLEGLDYQENYFMRVEKPLWSPPRQETPVNEDGSRGWTGDIPPPSLITAIDPSMPDMRGLWRSVSVEFNNTVIHTTEYVQRIEQLGLRWVISAGGIVHDCIADGTYAGRANDVSSDDKISPVEAICSTSVHPTRGKVLHHQPIVPMRAPWTVNRWVEYVNGKKYYKQERFAQSQLPELLAGTLDPKDVKFEIATFEEMD